MQIINKRIRNLQLHLPGIVSGQKIVAAAAVSNIAQDRLAKLGFAAAPSVGDNVLPAIIGPVTRYNANGKLIIHRDQPKETCYRQHYWEWTDWAGNHYSDVKDIPYERYPRTFVPPPSVSLTVVDLDGTALIVTPEITVDFQAPDHTLHCINLILEVAGGVCDVVTDTLQHIPLTNIHQLNWNVLPTGQMPWAQLKPSVQDLIEKQGKGNQHVVAFRLETVNSFGPEFVAVGNGGFHGYVIFGFPSKNLFVLECTQYGNATYVLTNDWVTLSQLTKAEILNDNLHKARFIHLQNWKDKVSALLG